MEKVPTRKSDKIKTSWGGVASWYDEVVNNSDSYQSQVILPNISRLIPLDSGKVIDIGCGQGFFALALAAKGNQVWGYDIAPELIDIATKTAQSMGDVVSKKVTFAVASAHDLAPAKDKSFDQAITILALQNIQDLEATVASAARVLKDGGVWTIVLNHPAFRQPKRSSWEWAKDVLSRRIDVYMSEYRQEIDMHPGQSSRVKSSLAEVTYSFHRPLQLYFKHLTKYGFNIIRLEEWISHKVSEPGPRSKEEDRMRKEIPMFICLQAKLTK